jgi:hypothetical protein
VPKPDYARITQLERELGIGEPPQREREQPIRPDLVCLVKNCDADTVELRTWSGYLLRRIHDH